MSAELVKAVKPILAKHGIKSPVFEEMEWGTYWHDGMREGQIVALKRGKKLCWQIHEWPQTPAMVELT